jgi:outer membrane lipoprotein carrier protein
MMMKMKMLSTKLTWITLFLLIFSGTANAQKNSARALLKKTLDKMSSYKNFEAGLSYSMDNQANNIHEKKTGTIYVEGDKFRIALLGQIIISDGKNMWTIIKDSKEVMLSALDPDDPSNVSPTKILKEYSDYDAKFDKNSSKGNLKTLLLTSKKKATFNKVTITVDASKYLVKKFSLYDNDGNVFTYDIYHFKANVNFPKGTFTYDPKQFPGYELEDMR